jgi:hypothetical protein
LKVIDLPIWTEEGLGDTDVVGTAVYEKVVLPFEPKLSLAEIV